MVLILIIKIMHNGYYGYCFMVRTASNSVAITWSVIGVVSVLIIGILLASFVTIMLSRFYAKQSEHLLYKYMIP